jgi:hypothetical protein
MGNFTGVPALRFNRYQGMIVDARFGGIPLPSDPLPRLIVMNGLVRIEAFGSFQQNLLRFLAAWVWNTAIADRTGRGALRLVEMADTLRTTLMGDHINDIVEALSVSDMIPSFLSIATLFKNCAVGTFRQTGATRNALIGNQ